MHATYAPHMETLLACFVQNKSDVCGCMWQRQTKDYVHFPKTKRWCKPQHMLHFIITIKGGITIPLTETTVFQYRTAVDTPDIFDWFWVKQASNVPKGSTKLHTP